MQIKLRKCKQGGNAILLGILLGLGLAMGGCAVKAIISRIHKIDKQRQQAATNCPPDDLVEFHGQLPESQFQPQDNAISPPLSLQSSPKFQVTTNWYNEALEDESGF